MGDDDDLIPRLFALLTARLEDGAALAADGQQKDIGEPDQRALATRLQRMANDIATLADAILIAADEHDHSR